jgi:hypothetical protein
MGTGSSTFSAELCGDPLCTLSDGRIRSTRNTLGCKPGAPAKKYTFFVANNQMYCVKTNKFLNSVQQTGSTVIYLPSLPGHPAVPYNYADTSYNTIPNWKDANYVRFNELQVKQITDKYYANQPMDLEWSSRATRRRTPPQQYIFGSYRVEHLVSAEFNKDIYLFFDEHVPDTCALGTAGRPISSAQFIVEQISSTQAPVDLFLETPPAQEANNKPFGQRKCSVSGGGDCYLDDLFNYVFPCFQKNPTNCPIANLKAVSVDIRQKSDDPLVKAAFEAIEQLLFPLNSLLSQDSITQDEVDTLMDTITNALANKEFTRLYRTPTDVMQRYQMQLEQPVVATALNRVPPPVREKLLAYLRALAERMAHAAESLPPLQQTLRALSGYFQELDKSIPKPYRSYTSSPATVIPHDIGSKLAEIYDILLSQMLYMLPVMDMYTLSLMFAPFESTDHRYAGAAAEALVDNRRSPSTVRNIIVYAGGAHCELYSDYLRNAMGFQLIEESNVDTTRGRTCTYLGNFKQPFFARTSGGRSTIAPERYGPDSSTSNPHQENIFTTPGGYGARARDLRGVTEIWAPGDKRPRSTVKNSQSAKRRR